MPFLSSPNEYTHSIGDQPQWAWGAVHAFRGLANPVGEFSLPVCPSIDSRGPEGTTTAYWSALHALLVFRLGWANPALGVCRWLDSEEDFHDGTLDLVREIWLSDGRIMDYVEWAHVSMERNPAIRHRGVDTDLGNRDRMLIEHYLDQAFGRQSRTNAVDRFSEFHGNFSGGPDALNLRTHLERSWQEPRASMRPVQNSGDGSRYVMFESGLGWYSSLDELDEDFDSDSSSQRPIDVYVGPIGFMGRFTKFNQTGIWASTSLAVHLLGNVSRQPSNGSGD